MTRTNHKPVDNKYIAVEELISRLSLSEVDVYHWLNRDKPKTREDHRGRLSVSIELLEKYSACDEYMEAFKRALVAERLSREADDLQTTLQLKNERSKFLDIYDVSSVRLKVEQI